MTTCEWAVWYADGSSMTNIEFAPNQVKRFDVICIAAYSDQHGRMIWHGTDYYIFETQWSPPEWISVDRAGLSDYLDRPGSEKIRLRGRHVPPRVFHEIYNKANADPRLPPRSSYDAREKIP